jgi:hypothetical protein
VDVLEVTRCRSPALKADPLPTVHAAPPSAASAAVASAAGGFRPASWAGPPSSIIACNAGFSSPPVVPN